MLSNSQSQLSNLVNFEYLALEERSPCNRFNRAFGMKPADFILLMNNVVWNMELSQRECELFGAWYLMGLREDVVKAMISFPYAYVKIFYGNPNFDLPKSYFVEALESKTRFLALNLFFDSIVAADHMYDSCKSHFDNFNRSGSKKLFALPIVPMNKNEPGTLKEMIDIFFKIVNNSQKYTREEIAYIYASYNKFIVDEKFALSLDHGREFTYDDAILHRLLTLYPHYSFASKLYYTSKLHASSGEQDRIIGGRIDWSIFLMGLLAQLRDDLMDIDDDIREDSPSTFWGALKTTGEILLYDPASTHKSYDSLEMFPKSAELLRLETDEILGMLPFQDEPHKVMELKETITMYELMD